MDTNAWKVTFFFFVFLLFYFIFFCSQCFRVCVLFVIRCSPFCLISTLTQTRAYIHFQWEEHFAARNMGEHRFSWQSEWGQLNTKTNFIKDERSEHTHTHTRCTINSSICEFSSWKMRVLFALQPKGVNTIAMHHIGTYWDVIASRHCRINSINARVLNNINGNGWISRFVCGWVRMCVCVRARIWFVYIRTSILWMFVCVWNKRIQSKAIQQF